ncbi:flagellum-specific peptidoglycan hydrolase FlgJ [Peribacillus sp. B2I2]
MSEESFIKEIAPYAQKIQKEFKILPSVVIAQLVWRVVMGQAY